MFRVKFTKCFSISIQSTDVTLYNKTQKRLFISLLCKICESVTSSFAEKTLCKGLKGIHQ